jgi:hypothetical protein
VSGGRRWALLDRHAGEAPGVSRYGRIRRQAHLFGDLWSHTGRFGGENRRLGGRWRHPVTNSYVLRIEGHGVKAPLAQRRRYLIDALIGRDIPTKSGLAVATAASCAK